jgi:hypothetical protein
MSSRPWSVFLMSVILLIGMNLSAQPGDRYLDRKSRVLDLVFPLAVEPKPYIQKLVMRFGDSNSQLVLITYPGGKDELLRYTLAGVGDEGLSNWLSKIVQENPGISDQAIAAKLQVVSTRAVVNYDKLHPLLNDLKAIRLSPILETRVALDECYEYEFWCDNWQESVHYTIMGPFKSDPQDRLVQWMIKFRDSSLGLLESAVPPNASPKK